MASGAAFASGALLLLATLSLPGTATVPADDGITRTFGAHVAAQLEFKGFGTGIYSPDQACPLTVFGIAAAVPEALYYQGARQITNLKTGELDITPGQQIPIPGQPCPIPGGNGAVDLTVSLAFTNFYGPYAGLEFDQSLCTRQLGAECFPDPLDSRAVLSRCPLSSASFVPNPGDPKGALGPLLGSRSIQCGFFGSDFDTPIEYYEDGPTAPGRYCNDWFFDSNAWGTDSCIVQVEDTVPLGNGVDDTGYLVTCMQTTVFVIDPLKGTTYQQTLRSHDWILVLDLDAPFGWLPALQFHLGAALRGFHDLGGKNGFPCPSGVLPPDKKVQDFGNILPSLQPPPCSQVYDNGVVTTTPCPAVCGPAGSVTVAAQGPTGGAAPIGRLQCAGGGALSTAAGNLFIAPGVYLDNTAGTVFPGASATCTHTTFGAAVFSIVQCVP